MKRIFFIVIMVTYVLYGQEFVNEPVGFASVNSLGVTTTTGGKGGKIVVITNADTLYKYLRNLRPDKNPLLPPTIFEIVGTVTKGSDKMIYLKGNANITIRGRGTNAKVDGWGFKIQNAYNVVIQNIEFANSPDDAICIEEGSHHVWVDHCTFSNAYDGLLDIKTQARYITVSWCYFSNHSKTSLVGHSDGETADTVISVTYHHCVWDGTEQRHPRVRFGKVHVFNNYHKGHKYYGIASTCEAKVYVESSYFENVAYPMHIGYAESPVGYIVERNNVFVNCGTSITDGREKTLGSPLTRSHSWLPSNEYNYTVDDPNTLKTQLLQYAGSGKQQLTLIYNNQSIPHSFVTVSNYPNPFNPITTLIFTVSNNAYTTLTLYNVVGEKIQLLYAGLAEANKKYEIKLDGSLLPSGVYYAVINNGTISKTHKIMLLK